MDRSGRKRRHLGKLTVVLGSLQEWEMFIVGKEIISGGFSWCRHLSNVDLGLFINRRRPGVGIICQTK